MRIRVTVMHRNAERCVLRKFDRVVRKILAKVNRAIDEYCDEKNIVRFSIRTGTSEIFEYE